MKSLYCLVIFAILLVSCESIPTGDALQTAIAQPTKTFVFNKTDIPTSIPPTPIQPTSTPITPDLLRHTTIVG